MPDNNNVDTVQEVVQSVMARGKDLLQDPKNQNAAIASAAAYYLSKNNKERNAIIAAVAAYVFLAEPSTKGSK